MAVKICVSRANPRVKPYALKFLSWGKWAEEDRGRKL